MNNPLNRSMFRQAGMSKQPMGILASSPELMTTAQKAMASGQPVTANNGRANFISTAPTVGFGLNNQPYIPFQQQKVDPRIRTKSGAPSSSLQNYINSMSSGIKTKDNRVIQKDESPLSPFGGEGRSITNAQKGFPISYLLKGAPGREEEFNKAGDEARAYYEAKNPRNNDMEGGDVSVQKSNVDITGNPTTINTSTKTALEKAVAKVTNESEYKQQVSEENAIAGTDVYGKETSATSQAQLVNEKGVLKSDAKIIIARSAIKTDNEDKAKEAYADVAKIATGSVAAEALFYNGYFKNKEGKYEASNVTIQKLAKDYSSYKYYSAKGLVVMAKNFYALDDAFQATYILESVISNFPDFDDIVQEARFELNKIKVEEAKTNSSIETDDN